jgi:hypothetical protein
MLRDSANEQVLVAALKSGGVVASMTVGYVKTPGQLEDFFGIKALDNRYFPVVVAKNVCMRQGKALDALRLEVLLAAQRLSAEALLSLETLSPGMLDGLLPAAYRIESIPLGNGHFSTEMVSVRLDKLRFSQCKSRLDKSAAPREFPGTPLFVDLLNAG